MNTANFDLPVAANGRFVGYHNGDDITLTNPATTVNIGLRQVASTFQSYPIYFEEGRYDGYLKVSKTIKSFLKEKWPFIVRNIGVDESGAIVINDEVYDNTIIDNSEYDLMRPIIVRGLSKGTSLSFILTSPDPYPFNLLKYNIEAITRRR